MIDSNSDNLDLALSSSSTPDVFAFENRLRPKAFKNYIGQDNIKKNLQISISATQKREDVLDHVLFHGAPGLGKTTLASVIANELGVSMKVTSGPALEKQGDVASIISNLEEGDIFFIDEIHRLKPVVEEVLYTAMEDFGIDIILGKGPSARSMRIDLPRFTLIGATTKLSMVSSPLRSRFGSLFKLQFYSVDDIKSIIMRSADILNVKIGDNEAYRIAQSSRQTPRIANRLLKRVRDFADVENNSIVTMKIVERTLTEIGVDEIGLDHVDRDILSIIIDKFNGGPVGLSTLAAAISEDSSTLEDVYEPFLIKAGLLERTQRGRIVTPRAYEHLNFPVFNDRFNNL